VVVGGVDVCVVDCFGLFDVCVWVFGGFDVLDFGVLSCGSRCSSVVCRFVLLIVGLSCLDWVVIDSVGVKVVMGMVIECLFMMVVSGLDVVGWVNCL